MAEIKKKTPELIRANASPDKIIPKFATSVNFSLVNNKYVIVTFIYSEPQMEGIAETVPPTLIERVIVDVDHAQTIVEKLQEVLSNVKTVKKDGPNISNTNK